MTKRVTIVLCCLAFGALLVRADDSDNDESAAAAPQSKNPYQAIADRNTFGLRPPPPPPETVKEKAPPPKITLTGITTSKGRKTVYLKTPGTPGKPGEAVKEQYYAIAEGVRDRDIEVVEINEKAGTVKVKYEGTEVALNFVDNGAKLIAPPPGQPGLPGAIPAPGGAMPQFPGAGGPASNVRPLPTRTLRLPTPGGGNAMAPGMGMATPNLVQQSVANRNQQHELSAEQQMVLVELERERTKEAVAAGKLPPLPPTPMSPPGSPGTMAPGAIPSLPPIPTR